MTVSEIFFGFLSLNTIGYFPISSLEPRKGFFKMRVIRTSIAYEIIRYKIRSIAKPPILKGEPSSSVSPKFRKGNGYPMAIEISPFPEISDLNGNVKTAISSTRRNINPKIAPIFFVGMSCLGNVFPMIWVIVSLPTYSYLGFLILTTSFCMLF